MSSDALTGSYNYRDLINTLKDHGVPNSKIDSAVKKIQSDNGIDDIKNLDKSQTITISTSIFDEQVEDAASNNDALALYTKTNDTNELPPVENYDEYDVADYDDYYGFQSDDAVETGTAPVEQNENEAQDETEMDFETFSAQYASTYVTDPFASDTVKDEILKKQFNILDTNSDGYLNQAELASVNYSRDDDDKEYINGGTEDDPLIGSMEMDMSGSAFNAQ